jgi:hypothetical protein
MNQRAKYDKSAKSKDIIIMAKDKKIKELEEENKKLKDVSIWMFHILLKELMNFLM